MGFSQYPRPAGRRGTVPLRHDPDGGRPEARCRQQDGAGALPPHRHAAARRPAGHRRHRRDPVLLRHLGDGGRLCQLRHDEAGAGHQRHPRRPDRHQRHRLDHRLSSLGGAGLGRSAPPRRCPRWWPWWASCCACSPKSRCTTMWGISCWALRC